MSDNENSAGVNPACHKLPFVFKNMCRSRMSAKCYVIKVFWITEFKCIAYPLIHYRDFTFE